MESTDIKTKEIKERINYRVLPNGTYFGYLVNLPQVCATSITFDGLEKALHKGALKYLSFYINIIAEGKFEFNQVEV